MIRSRVWTRQPPPGTPIDWGNPLTDDLRFLYCGNALVDVVGGRKFSTVGTQYSSRAGSEGITTSWGGAGSVYVPRDTGLEPPVASWAAYTKTPGAIGNYARPFGKTYNNGTAAPYVSYDFEWNLSGGNPDSVQATSTSGGSATATPLVVIPTGSKTICVATNSGSLLSLYVNGLLRESTAMAGPIAYDTSATGNLVIAGSNAATASNEWIGDLYLAALWGRVLTPADVWNFSDNPWQLFWKRQRTYSLASSGGGVTALAGIIESLDAIAATATLSVSASAAVLEASDAIAAAAHASVTASAAILASSDAMVGTAASGANASGTILEGADSLQATATASTAANGAITETADSIAASATAFTSASAAILESSDTISAIASAGISASALILESADSILATASLSISALAAFVESPDVIVARATASVSAAAAVAEGGDSIAAFASVAGAAVSASAAIVEQSDIVSGFASASLTPDPCMMVYLPTRNLTATLPTRNLTANLEC